jgi:hypothetical protein
MQDEWTKKERNKMQRGGGTTMSEEWRDAESLVAFVMQDPTWTSVCSVLLCN